MEPLPTGYHPSMVAPVQRKGFLGPQLHELAMKGFSPLAQRSADNGGALILSDAGKPSDNHARVTQALWDDYKTNFAPYQYQLLNSMTTERPEIVGQAVGQAQGMIGRSFDNAARNKQVTMERYGMAPDAQTSASMQRQTGMAKTAALAGAANATRAHLKERDMELMTSGVPNVAGRSYGMQGG